MNSLFFDGSLVVGVLSIAGTCPPPPPPPPPGPPNWIGSSQTGGVLPDQFEIRDSTGQSRLVGNGPLLVVYMGDQIVHEQPDGTYNLKAAAITNRAFCVVRHYSHGGDHTQVMAFPIRDPAQITEPIPGLDALRLEGLWHDAWPSADEQSFEVGYRVLWSRRVEGTLPISY